MTLNIRTLSGSTLSEKDASAAFMALFYKGVWGSGGDGGMTLRISTADALAMARNPATKFSEALALCYLLDKRVHTEGVDDTLVDAIESAKSEIFGKVRSIEASGIFMGDSPWEGN
jgi:hypothetical protein